MEEYGIPGVVLMENAARGIVEAVLQRFRNRRLSAVACGPGNNGGDGFAAARHLVNAGREVVIHLARAASRYIEGHRSAINLRIADRMGIEIRGERRIRKDALILDAVFGTGPDHGTCAAATAR